MLRYVCMQGSSLCWQDGLLVENMHDVPWQRSDQLGPETVASLAAVAAALRRQHPHIPIGIQVLTAGNKEALAIAKAAGNIHVV